MTMGIKKLNILDKRWSTFSTFENLKVQPNIRSTTLYIQLTQIGTKSFLSIQLVWIVISNEQIRSCLCLVFNQVHRKKISFSFIMASEFTNSTSQAQVLINNSRNIMAATSTSDDAEANLATGCFSNQFWNFY